jgi:hypothetical protein
LQGFIAAKTLQRRPFVGKEVKTLLDFPHRQVISEMILTGKGGPGCYRDVGPTSEVTMSVSRRTILVGSAILSATVVKKGIAGGKEPINELSALIEAHRTAYSTFMKAIREPDGTSNDHTARSQDEERALLAVCGFPAICKADRRAKATYLLQIEERGELDLREHVQTILFSMMVF